MLLSTHHTGYCGKHSRCEVRHTMSEPIQLWTHHTPSLSCSVLIINTVDCTFA